MPEPISVSFRDQTTGRINDFLIDEDKACAPTQNLLAYFAGALLSYKDEGVEFAPQLVVCDHLDAFLNSFPGAVSHTIGEAPLDPAFGPKILKDCAPLSGSNWYIFVERYAPLEIRYGVFTYFRLPTAIPLYEGITINADQFAILVRKISSNTIEMRGAKGSLLTLIFSTLRESTNIGTSIEQFTADCCTDVTDPKIAREFKSYFHRLLEASLTSSHGTILICARDLDLKSIPEMNDAVLVTPHLDFQTSFSDFHISNSAGSILTLQRCEELLQGFLRCDGLIAFDTRGRITAYRIFFRPIDTSVDASNIVGGARRRAYEGIRKLVGKQLLSALFRSQDGLTLHHRLEK